MWSDEQQLEIGRQVLKSRMSVALSRSALTRSRDRIARSRTKLERRGTDFVAAETTLSDDQMLDIAERSQAEAEQHDVEREVRLTMCLRHER